MYPARGCVRLACLAQPGAQGAARRLDNQNGADPPRPAGASGPPPAPAARCGRGGPPGISGTFRGTETAFRVPVAGRARGARPAVEHD